MLIPLQNTADKYALIDAEDYPLVRAYRWHLQHNNDYAIASWGDRGKTGRLRMHRVVLMVGPSKEVDHKNHQGLDNRKDNLRACTHSENMCNGRNPVNGSTGIRGVFKIGKKFVAKVTRDGVRHQKSFLSLDEAAACARAMRSELHGEFAFHGDYARDLALVADDEACFFAAMGEANRARVGGTSA